MYKAVLFSEDGDYVSDFLNSETIEEVVEKIDNMGSRWIFYPIWAVVNQDDNTIIETSDEWVYLLDCGIKEFSEEIVDYFNFKIEGIMSAVTNIKVLAVPAKIGVREKVESLYLTTQTERSLSQIFEQGFVVLPLYEFQDELNNMDDDAPEDCLLRTHFFTHIIYK